MAINNSVLLVKDFEEIIERGNEDEIKEMFEKYHLYDMCREFESVLKDMISNVVNKIKTSINSQKSLYDSKLGYNFCNLHNDLESAKVALNYTINVLKQNQY